MDRIELKASDIELLLKWRDSHKDLVRSVPAPLKAVEIAVKDNGMRIIGVRKDRELKLSVFHQFDKLGSFTLDVSPVGQMILRKKAGILEEDDRQSVITVYCSLMALMTYGERVVEPREPKERKTSQKPLNRPKTKAAKRATYILRAVGDALYAAPTGSHASPSGVFTVRGHYRHYKNGRVVWIAEYKKGTGRKKKKTYRMGDSDREAVKQIGGVKNVSLKS